MHALVSDDSNVVTRPATTSGVSLTMSFAQGGHVNSVEGRADRAAPSSMCVCVVRYCFYIV
jgi:hypothetical protein